MSWIAWAYCCWCGGIEKSARRTLAPVALGGRGRWPRRGLGRAHRVPTWWMKATTYPPRLGIFGISLATAFRALGKGAQQGAATSELANRLFTELLEEAKEVNLSMTLEALSLNSNSSWGRCEASARTCASSLVQPQLHLFL